MLHIAGGTYIERCQFPPWNELYGSGLRAAVSLSRLSPGIRLHTYVDRDNEMTLRAKAATFGFEVSTLEVSRSLEFDYFHGLSTPAIYPSPGAIQPCPALRVDGEAVLRFGLLDGDAVINAKWAVYDPQSAFMPTPFHANGSRADKLAVVCNSHEARLLTGASGTEDQARAMLESPGTTAVVVKRGARGCFVLDIDGLSGYVPAYRTPTVWPIGSGDVFSAVFSCFWVEHGLSALEAAHRASRATASYCSNQELVITEEVCRKTDFSPVVLTGNRTKVIYLAGPFFTMSQRWLIEEARQSLWVDGIKVFSPFHDVGQGDANEVYAPDMAGIEASDVVLACVESLDFGTQFEVGYAVALGKRVVAFVQNQKEEDLKMLRGSACDITDDFVTAVYKAIWAAMSA